MIYARKSFTALLLVLGVCSFIPAQQRESAFLHIINRHTTHGNNYNRPNTSLFHTAATPKEQLTQIVEYCTQARDQGVQVDDPNGQIRIHHEFNRRIGRDVLGNPTNKILLILDRNPQNLITAYPIQQN